jgi:gluconolactonase
MEISKVIEIKESNAFLESPAVAPDGSIFFPDIANNRILRFNPEIKDLLVWREKSGRANGMTFDIAGDLIVCEGNEMGPNDGGRRIVKINTQSGDLKVLTDNFQGKKYNAPNDLVINKKGQIFFTDPCYGNHSYMELDHESVYRIDIDGKVTRIITQPQIQRPNGLALSSDEKILYIVDSLTAAGGNRKIWAFDLDDNGEVSNQRLVFDFAPGRGGDGMTVDKAGNLYVAAGINKPRDDRETGDFQAGIYIISPQGELKGKIFVPEDLITNVDFDKGFKALYITAGKTLYFATGFYK